MLLGIMRWVLTVSLDAVRLSCNFNFQAPNPKKSTGLSSTALTRAPAPSKNFVRGKSGYVPFLPGGLDEVLVDALADLAPDHSTRGLRTIAPGLDRGLRLPGDEIPEAVVEIDSFMESPASVGDCNGTLGYHIDEGCYRYMALLLGNLTPARTSWNWRTLHHQMHLTSTVFYPSL